MEFALLLSIIATVLQLVGFAIYNRQIITKTSKPNASTWILWVYLTVLNFTSYMVMSDDLVKSILPIASSVACILTFCFAWYKGSFSRLNFWDKIVLSIGLIAGAVWWYYQSATYANIIVQIALIVSFIPTIRGVMLDAKNEKALPWWIWTLAYSLQTITVFFRWQGQFQDLIYPINCLILHGIIGFLSKE